ncbi:hypothetical protein [Aureimonas ureilytica]|uniref:hypothetical protein n=1 Tax=Aureimonas ureilytica TaxID=401562 RepID=UPI0003608400|nr:hypothetical protein [Aureimonas ureilytica]
MTATILSFGRRQPNTPPLPAKTPWQNQDLAELYRVRDRLCAAGLEVETEAGVTDEGDPWFVYAQAGTDNVVVHIARIDSEIHVINCVTGGTYVGPSFREVSDRMLEEAPLALSAQVRRSSNVVLHPSAFLTAFVAAALMLIDLLEHNKAEAATLDGAHEGAHASDWVVTTGSAHDASASGGDTADAAGDEASHPDGADGALHRRSAKDAPGSAPAMGATAGPGPMAMAATGLGALSAHGGFLAEVPGVGASVTLAAGILAAELARSFTGEGEHPAMEPGAGLAKDFASLLSAFASAEPAHAKALPAEAEGGAMATIATSAVATPVDAGGVATPHLAVASLTPIGAPVSVKSAPDGFVEHFVFAAPDAHRPSAPTQPSPAQSLSASAQEAARPAPTPSESAGPVSGPATGTVQAPSATAAASPAPPPAPSPAPQPSPAKAEPAKDAAALDIGWVVAQLVKHGSSADLGGALSSILSPNGTSKDGTNPAFLISDAASALDKATGKGSAALTGTSLLADLGTGASVKGDAAKTGLTGLVLGGDSAKGTAGTAESGKADSAKLDLGKDDLVRPDAGKIDPGKSDPTRPDLTKADPVKTDATATGGTPDAAKADGASGAKTDAKTDAGATSGGKSGLVTTIHPDGSAVSLQAGHHETVVYKAGTVLVVNGFVLGEDYLAFDPKVGDAMSAKAHAEGTDLVLGDGEIGMVRLVGVLADTTLLTHLYEGRASAA